MSELRLIIDSSFDEVPAVGEAVRARCRHEGWSESDAALVELGLVEAVNNSIEHSYGGKAGGAIEILVVVDGATVSAEISDSGTPLNVQALDDAQAPSFDPADRSSLPEGGFGLAIIRTIFDEVSIAPDGGRNRLTLKKWRGAS